MGDEIESYWNGEHFRFSLTEALYPLGGVGENRTQRKTGEAILYFECELRAVV